MLNFMMECVCHDDKLDLLTAMLDSIIDYICHCIMCMLYYKLACLYSLIASLNQFNKSD